MSEAIVKKEIAVNSTLRTSDYTGDLRAGLTRWLPVLASLCTALLAPSLWAQTGWQTGENTVFVPSGTNVGIGTPNPVSRLDFGNSAANAKLVVGTYVFNQVWTGIGMDPSTAGVRLAGDPLGSTNPLVDVGYYSNDANHTWASRMYVRNDGNVGIGTTSPQTPLHVAGDTLIGGTNAQNNHGITFVDSALNGSAWAGWARISALGSVDGRLSFYTNTIGAGLTEKMSITRAGNVGIGTTSPQHTLSVNGTIGTKEVIVTNTGWADYVFRPGYRLRSLADVASFIKQHQHLPDIPSEEEVRKKGLSVGEMQAKLLAKIEELTLHVIQEHQRNDRLEQQNREIYQELAVLKQKLSQHAGVAGVLTRDPGSRER